LTIAEKQHNRVHFIKWGVFQNWLSGHMILEVNKKDNTVVVKGWTNSGHIKIKSLEGITGVFLDTEKAKIDELKELYERNKKLDTMQEHTIDSARDALINIQKNGKQFIYMRKWTNIATHWIEPKTILAINKTHVTYASYGNKGIRTYTIALWRIWHIIESSIDADTRILHSK
jgi:hypothetical protein